MHPEVVNVYEKRREMSKQKHKPPFNLLQKPLISCTHEENAIRFLAIISVTFYCNYHVNASAQFAIETLQLSFYVVKKLIAVYNST